MMQKKLKNDRGVGTVLTSVVIMIVCVATFWAVVLCGWLGSIHKAKLASDMASLAGAHGLVAGSTSETSVCVEAERVALKNGAHQAYCELSLGAGEYLVKVTAEVPMSPSFPGVPKTVKRTSISGKIA